MRLRKGLQKEESIDGSCVRSYVIVPRCSCGFQDPGHKTPSQGFKILIRIQGYIQDYDVVRYGASVISELTQWSGSSLTRLASDLGQARQKYVCTNLNRRLLSLAPTNEESAWLNEEKKHIGKKKSLSIECL
jgi:hypothetical protein